VSSFIFRRDRRSMSGRGFGLRDRSLEYELSYPRRSWIQIWSSINNDSVGKGGRARATEQSSERVPSPFSWEYIGML